MLVSGMDEGIFLKEGAVAIDESFFADRRQVSRNIIRSMYSSARGSRRVES